MRRIPLILALTLFGTGLFSGSLWAMHCPQDMAKIDQLLKTDPPADPEVLAEVKRLRAEGEELHQAGDHSESMKVLAEALNLLQASE
ncbi:hypothetical protein [Aquipseudomonas ullengensis]|uniref:EAL domain-containing protein n=1 Tax=Aquipseudomonas ullengensis TaxID=2759166 RepID=A0A7W4Q8M7_9GAMM|nr:hypothetical protein [Pseudomonas ullengensis]MBB2493500.1 hypothetical protein [Pseudomonas ullengensis]